MSVEIEQVPTDGEVVFDLHGDGLYLRGERVQIEALLDGLLSPTEVAARRDRNVGAADIAAGAASVGAVMKASEEYLRLSPETLAKLKDGAELSDDGQTFRGFLRKAGKMAGDVKQSGSTSPPSRRSLCNQQPFPSPSARPSRTWPGPSSKSRTASTSSPGEPAPRRWGASSGCTSTSYPLPIRRVLGAGC